MDDIRVITVIDSETVVINKGSSDGITQNDKFVIYELLEEFRDPMTEKNLGRLRLKKGTAKIYDIQENMTIIVSNVYKNITRTKRNNIGSFGIIDTSTKFEESERQPFERTVYEGDIVNIYNRTE